MSRPQYTRFWGLLLLLVCVWHGVGPATLGHVHGPEQSDQDCALCHHQHHVPLPRLVLMGEGDVSFEKGTPLAEEPPSRRSEIVLSALVSRGPPSY